MYERYLLLTLPGLEDIVKEECERKGINVLRVKPHGIPARLVVRGEISNVRCLRTIESASQILDIIKLKDRSELRYTIRDILRRPEVSTLLKGISTATVRGFVESNKVKKRDLERIVARELIRIHPGIITIPNGGDIKIRVEFYKDNTLVLGIEIPPLQPLHRRYYTVFIHPAMLNPLIAASIAYIFEPKKDTLIYDPFCGSGTIPIEIAYVYEDVSILASDISETFVKGAILNAREAGVIDRIQFLVSDAQYSTFKEQSIDIVVTDPPRGHREVVDPVSLLDKIFKSFKNILKRNGLLILVSPYRQIIKVLSLHYKFSIVREIEALQGGQKVSIIALRSS